MEIIERASDPQVLEAGLVISLQHIIHHDISGFGACRSYAKALGLKKATDQLDTMLKDEKEIDGELTQLAITRLNEEAIAPIIES